MICDSVICNQRHIHRLHGWISAPIVLERIVVVARMTIHPRPVPITNRRWRRAAMTPVIPIRVTDVRNVPLTSPRMSHRPVAVLVAPTTITRNVRAPPVQVLVATVTPRPLPVSCRVALVTVISPIASK